MVVGVCVRVLSHFIDDVRHHFYIQNPTEIRIAYIPRSGNHDPKYFILNNVIVGTAGTYQFFFLISSSFLFVIFSFSVSITCT